jgi:hypothetical protein
VAAETIGPNIAASPKAKPGSGPVKHTLMGTFINSNETGATVGTGQTTIDTETINCTNAAGCTIQADGMVQFADINANFWAVCFLVDGIGTQPACPYQGRLPGGGALAFAVGNYRGWYPVAKGTHTVTLTVYSGTATGKWEEFEDSIQLFKP